MQSIIWTQQKGFSSELKFKQVLLESASKNSASISLTKINISTALSICFRLCGNQFPPQSK